MTPTIYLSSTYEDLQDHRRVVHEALRKSGYRVIAMEDYVAADNRPLKACLDDIHDEVQIYVGLFAFRYGYVPPEAHIRDCPHTAHRDEWQGLSITELEFRFAQELGRPCLVFVAKEGQPWDLNHVDAYAERGKAHPGQRIDRLRRHLLQEKMASPFSSPHELASLVQAGVVRHLQAAGRLSAIQNTQPAITWPIDTQGSPYPGLLHFTRRHSPVYFGREREVREVFDRLHTHRPRFLLVSGDSGVGKSSFVEAGLLPLLEESGLPGAPECTWVRMVPSGGPHPFDALMRALDAHAKQAGRDPFQTGEALCQNPARLPECMGDIMAMRPDRSALVLFLDQMEEMFTTQAKAYAAAFLSALYETARQGLWWVIATIRSDHLHHCERHPDLLTVLRGQGFYPLGPVDPIAMADMIRKPARCAGLEITGRLVSQIVKAAGAEAGSLPLLAFALQRLYEARDGPTLSEQVYQKLGGVAGAVADHVRAVERKLRQNKAIGPGLDGRLPALFQELVVVNSEGLPTRRRVRLADLSPELEPLADGLIKARLLTSEGQGADSTVSVAHEKLFQAWPILVHWIAEHQDDLRVLRQADIESREWEKSGHDLAYLWRVDRLKKLQEIVRRLDSPTLSERVRRYAVPQEDLAAKLDDAGLSHPERMEIGLYLAELGDPRLGLGLRADGLPDVAWSRVPGGEITLEGGAVTLRVEPFYIARYPVTWIQYRVFLEDPDGYRDEGWWKGLAERREEPGDQYRKYDNYPAENVSWYDAVAYCRWLTTRLGFEIRLPAEWQWQQAATGGNPNCEYPWGPEWDWQRANTTESGLGRTTAVGLYPQGASPVGALDMSGNVEEWCLNEYQKPKRTKMGGDAPRVVRGGSWDYFQLNARAGYRNHCLPYGRIDYLGFRLSCASPI
jgi:formylglycine-generating enzyme required for sulfatase activity